MLTQIYIEALLVDEELADQVWEAWDVGKIDDVSAFSAWLLLAYAKLNYVEMVTSRLNLCQNLDHYG